MHLNNHHDQHHRQHQYDNQRDDIDYESLYLKMATILIMMNVIIMIDTIKTITIEMMIIVTIDHQNDNHDYHDSNFDKTTNLYKELTDSNMIKHVLFKALMLYARENNKTIDITDHLNIVMMTNLETNIKRGNTLC